jgi:hypothetical protein
MANGRLGDHLALNFARVARDPISQVELFLPALGRRRVE